MSDAFLPGNGFDTYETQDKVLVSMAAGAFARGAGLFSFV